MCGAKIRKAKRLAQLSVLYLCLNLYKPVDMKFLYTLILSFWAVCALAVPNNTFSKLYELNRCWAEQLDVANISHPIFDDKTEREWISTHLQLVEQTLRNRTTAHLNQIQKANRQYALNQLNTYWKSGGFPVNDLYNYRTPIFIDRYDNFCAVGYLIKATGHEAVSRKIAATTNMGYVRDLNYPEFSAWANDYGFSIDELAWIQPSYIYTPRGICNAVGKGTDGEVFELYVSNAGDKLYVGGLFTKADSTITANSIAYVTEQNGIYTWHNIGDGVNGSVYAIAEYDNKLYIGGSFSISGSTQINNVAYWDGSKWNATGCIYGTVKDLLVYKNELYAAGDFDVCAAMSEVNFAKWDGTSWIGGYALDGHVNTMEVVGNDLVLGGQFTFNNNPENIIKWNAGGVFTPYASAIANEVMDIQSHKDVLFVSTKLINDTAGLIRYLDSSNTWAISAHYIDAAHDRMAVNSMYSSANNLYAGGDFHDTIIISPGTPLSNFGNIYYPSGFGGDYFAVDSAVNIIAKFKNKVVAGGKFDKDLTKTQLLNSIAVYQQPSGVQKIGEAAVEFALYPNPANQNITVTNNFNAEYFKMYDASGRVVLSTPIGGTSATVVLKALAPGIYVAEIGDAAGNKRSQKVVIER